MSFKVWLENIEVSPHMPELFWDEILDKAKKIESYFIPMNEIEKLERYLYDEEGWDSKLDYDLRFLYKSLNNDDYRSRLSDKIESLKESYKTDSHRKKTFIEGDLKKLDYFNDELFKSRYKDYVNSFTNFFRTKKNRPNINDIDLSQMSDINQEKCKKLINVYKAAFNYIILIKKASRAARATLDYHDRHTIAYNQQHSSDKEKGKVPYDGVIPPKNLRETEILYHATPFTKEILFQGYKNKEELGNLEMLGGDTEGGISFTADLNIAKEIAKCLKEVTLIAQGKIKINDVIKMVKMDKNFANQSSDGNMWPLKNFINVSRSNQSKKATFKSNPELEKFIGKIEDVSGPKEVFEMYKRYLAYTKKRYNPVFFMTDVNSFKNLDVNNIGVLASKVDINKTIKYLDSMEEYRIPPSAIIQTWKVKI